MRLSLSAVVLLAFTASAKEPASLEDLKALAQNKAYPEL